MNRINPSVSELFPDCQQTSHTTNNLFNCTSKPTNLTPANLWKQPKKTAIFLNLHTTLDPTTNRSSKGNNNNSKVFELYATFERMRRRELPINEYIPDFGREYNQIKIQRMVTAESVLVCKLLLSTDLDIKERHLLLCDITNIDFTQMRSCTAHTENGPFRHATVRAQVG